MSEPMRVPMKPRGAMIGPDDIAASIVPGLRCGRRFSIDVAEDAFAKGAGQLIEVVAKQLAEQAVWHNEQEIRNVVYSYIHDRKWAEPILREAFREAAKEFVRDYMQDAEDRIAMFREMLRVCNWADLGEHPRPTPSEGQTR